MPTEAVDPGLAAPAEAVLSPAAELSRGHRAWVTIVLALVWFLAATDRNILAVLLVPIQKDLGVGDAAMGMLTGTAFALVYASAALPLAWFADRTNRHVFLAGAVAAWSVMTALCGLSANYVQLLLARFGVAAGEAAHGPTSMSMVADVFPPARRGAAISVLTIGSAAGFSGGAVLAGVLNDRFGWHGALMAVGLPGLLVAALVLLTVPEPRRGAHDAVLAAPVSVVEGIKRMTRIRTFWPLMLGMVSLNIAFMGYLNWLPTFLTRIHHLSTTEASAIFGIVVGIGGIVSNIVAGVASDRLARRGARFRMFYCVGMAVVSAPILGVGFLVDSTPLAVTTMVVYALCAGGLTTVTAASALSISPSSMRASMSALIGLAIAAIGGGIGPLLMGLLTDALKASYGESAIRYTMLTTPFAVLLAAAMFLLASRSMDADAAAASGAARQATP